MSTSPETRLEAAVLVDSEYVEQWQRNALVKLITEESVEITSVVVNDLDTDADPDHGPVSFLRDASERVREYPLWSLVGVARLLATTPDFERSVPLDSVAGVSDADWVACTPQRPKGHWTTFPEDVVDQLAGTDIAVRFGFGMIRGDVLDAPTYGVLSYHMGDIREYRGQPGGFWEFLNDEARMGVTVQRLTDTLDGGEIAALDRFDIEGENTYQEVWAEAHHRAEGMLVPAVRAVTEPDQSVTEPDNIGTLYSIPERWDVCRYVVKNTRGRVRNDVAQNGLRNRIGRKQLRNRIARNRLRNRIEGWDRGLEGRLPTVHVAFLVVGGLLAGLRPLVTGRPLDDIHPEQVAGVVLLSAGIISFLTNKTDDGGPAVVLHGCQYVHKYS